MTLPDLLTEAARLMPERFTYDWPRRVIEVNMPMTISRTAPAQWRTVYYWDDTDWELDDSCALLWVEAACREECEARGWHAAYIPTIDGQRLAVTIYRNGSGETLGTSWASTPAEALLTALIQAVEGERV